MFTWLQVHRTIGTLSLSVEDSAQTGDVTRPDEFDIAAIEKSAGLAALRFFPKTESTNDSAIAWIGEGNVPTPALVLTADQTRGRGQRERSWFSAPGNLAASWIFSAPPLDADRAQWAGRISIAAALAVHDTIAAELAVGSNQLHVKWPNDIHLGTRKISGILIETRPGPNGSYGVIGIGINVNRPASTTDPGFEEVADSATSMRQQVGRETALTDLVIALSLNLCRRLKSVESENYNWQSEYNSQLTGLHRPVTIRSSGPDIDGLCRGIDANGALLIETADGIQTVTSGSLIIDPDPHDDRA